MKILTSYFYQIRNMSNNMIPLSTAKFDPTWFHQGTYDLSIQFKDKNGVWNGLRAEPFVPGEECTGLCFGSEYCDPPNPDKCDFLRIYKQQLDRLDFNEIWNRFERLSNEIQKLEGFLEEPVCILLFHEAYWNPCSERWMVIKWFQEHGYDIKEFNLENIKRKK